MADRFTPFTSLPDCRPTATDWPFPFPPPGRRRAEPPGSVAPATAYCWPFGAVDATPIPSRPVPAPVPLAEFVREVATWWDDVGVVS